MTEEDIDLVLHEMWNQYAIQPTAVWVDGRYYERMPQRVIVHWDRHGWTIGTRSA